MTTYPTAVLCILDGFGYREDSADNAIKLAHTPNYDRYWGEAPRAWLKTSGLAVGLPDGQMGNSEVGHMNIGGGRVVMQDLPRIDAAVKDDSLAQSRHLGEFITKIKAVGGKAHIMGLMSNGGVHSHQDHIVALARILTTAGLDVVIHAITDGRDTAPKSAMDFLMSFEAALPAGARIATISGRYFAMDRDNRWERVQKAFDQITQPSVFTANARAAIDAAYSAGLTDEFIEPRAIAGYRGFDAGDGLVCANFRSDRVRQIMSAFADSQFNGFDRGAYAHASAFLTMTKYSDALAKLMPSLFPPQDIRNSLGEVLSSHGLPQLRIAETEKYAHVTFFLNGGREAAFKGEDRILVPSPDVATYDLAPEMSAAEVTEKLSAAIRSQKYAAIIVNYANPDMVGHTGVLPAAIKAVETIDSCLGDLEKAITDVGGTMLITADHGNVELMRDLTTGEPHTAHTHYDVPVVKLGADDHGLADGALADLAPTMLALLGVAQPPEMTGTSLLTAAQAQRQSA